MMKRTILFLMAMIMATAMVFAGGSQESGSQEASPQGGSAEEASSDGPQSGGVMVFDRSGVSVGLDPARETGVT
jgi:hypothetical protein